MVDTTLLTLGEHQEFGVEKPAIVFDGGKQDLDDVGAGRLEPALSVGEPGGQNDTQQDVVGARDDLASDAPYYLGAVRQRAADRQVAVTGKQRRDQREERVEAGGQVGVHVGDDVRLAAAPDMAERESAALAVQVHGPDRGPVPRTSARALPKVPSVLALSAMVMTKGKGKLSVK